MKRYLVESRYAWTVVEAEDRGQAALAGAKDLASSNADDELQAFTVSELVAPAVIRVRRTLELAT